MRSTFQVEFIIPAKCVSEYVSIAVESKGVHRLGDDEKAGSRPVPNFSVANYDEGRYSVDVDVDRRVIREPVGRENTYHVALRTLGFPSE